jgi:hypothetical protein
MIDQKIAKKQTDRLQSLDKWLLSPENAAVHAELLRMINTAESDQIGVCVINEILEESAKLPTPAQLRRRIAEANFAASRVRRGCALCDGVGFKTVWQLITYKSESYLIKRREDLPDIENQEQADTFQRAMLERPGTDTQIVLSAARRCPCNG